MLFARFWYGSQGKYHSHRAAGLFPGDALQDLVDLRTVQIVFHHLVPADNGQYAVCQRAGGAVEKHPLIHPQGGLIILLQPVPDAAVLPGGGDILQRDPLAAPEVKALDFVLEFEDDACRALCADAV